jgi:hypothetical protein
LAAATQQLRGFRRAVGEHVAQQQRGPLGSGQPLHRHNERQRNALALFSGRGRVGVARAQLIE